MRRACHQVPTEPALIGISYDAGQASKRRPYVPIVLSVANTDSRCSDACTCLGYMPVFDLQAYSLPVRKAVMHDLRQACIGAIICPRRFRVYSVGTNPSRSCTSSAITVPDSLSYGIRHQRLYIVTNCPHHTSTSYTHNIYPQHRTIQVLLLQQAACVRHRIWS